MAVNVGFCPEKYKLIVSIVL